MTPNLEEMLARWQRLLYLQDWDVSISLLRRSEMDDCVGQCEHILTRKAARIDLMDPQDYREDQPGGDDLEQTLVHELLHLHVAPFEAKEGTAEEIAQEQMIDRLAWAFVKQDRLTRGETMAKSKGKSGGPMTVGKGGKPKGMPKKPSGTYKDLSTAKTKVKGSRGKKGMC